MQFDDRSQKSATTIFVKLQNDYAKKRKDIKEGLRFRSTALGRSPKLPDDGFSF